MHVKTLVFILAVCWNAEVLAVKHHVFGGDEVDPHQYPWMTTVIFGYGFCGGALVRVHPSIQESDVVLTASHCVSRQTCKEDDCPWVAHDLKQFYALLGNHAISVKESSEQLHPARLLVHHPCWGPNILDYCGNTTYPQLWFSDDIGLIFLKKPIPFTAGIGPLDLPEPFEPPPKTKCHLAGWGDHMYKTNEQAKNASDVLRALDVTFIEDESSCEKAYGFAHGSLEPFLCAKTEKQAATACQGDSGGPIWCDGQKGAHPKVYAVVSANGGYCGGNLPGLFTDVGKYMPWIKEQINKHSMVINKNIPEEKEQGKSAKTCDCCHMC